MARHPQHDNIRKLKGDPNLDRYSKDAIVVDAIMELPNPPEWWPVKTVQFYEKKGAQMIAHNMLTVLDVEYLEMYCLLYCKMNKLWQADETPAMSMYTQLNSFAAQLGLNPISRQKFKADTGAKKGNKYDKPRPNK